MYGFCENGCKSDAKSSALVTYQALATRTANDILRKGFNRSLK